MSADKKLFTASPRSGKASIASMAGASMAFQYATWNAIQQLAEVKGTVDLEWLDELHQVSVAEVKSSIGEGLPIEDEAEALQFGVDVLKAAFEAYRARLVKAGDK
jgi:hypothetical protein